jgi:hypothetical protein
MTNQPSVYELQDSADVDKIAQELVSSATLDRAVPIPAVLQQNAGGKQSVTLYVRPAAWGQDSRHRGGSLLTRLAFCLVVGCFWVCR